MFFSGQKLVTSLLIGVVALLPSLIAGILLLIHARIQI